MLTALRKSPNYIIRIQNRVKFPEKFRGTIMETWAKYWKNLFIDYRQMLQDLRTDIQDNPQKAIIWTAGLTTLYALAKNNPTEIDFKDNLKKITNDVILVSDDCRNPKSVDFLRFLQTCYNEEIIHYRSFGIISFMYTSELNDSCDLYKAHCQYLEPSYLSMLSKIVDIGFMGKWWNTHIKTTNYDINPLEKLM